MIVFQTFCGVDGREVDLCTSGVGRVIQIVFQLTYPCFQLVNRAGTAGELAKNRAAQYRGRVIFSERFCKVESAGLQFTADQ